MEKTTNIVLGGMRFEMAEAAFRALDAYLKSLAEHLSADEDRAEIIRDIEARIAEKFAESGEGTVSLATVESVIHQMGSPEDIASDDVPSPSARKLYRDIDTGILGGVGSGIAAYLGVDAVFVRAAFLLSIFLGGTGIMLYLLLWLLVPAARTASQKLEMRGSAVTLKAMQDLVRGSGDTLARSGVLRRAIYFPFELLGSVLRGIARFMPGAGKLVGVLIALLSFLAILGITTLAIFGAVNLQASYIEMPLREAVSSGQLYSLIFALYLAAAIPFVFLLLLAQRLIRASARIAPAAVLGLIGVWSVAVITSGALGFSTAGEYANYLETSPRYAVTSRALELAPYRSIEVASGVEVRIASGAAQEASVEASQRDLDRVTATVKDGVLTIAAEPRDGTCFFCGSGRPVVTLATPVLDSVRVENGSVVFDDFAGSSLAIEMHQGYVRGDIDVGALDVSGQRFTLDLTGSAGTASFRAEDGTVRAAGLEVEDASVEARGYSSVGLWVTGSLDAYADARSSVRYRGLPASVAGNAVSEDAEPAAR